MLIVMQITPLSINGMTAKNIKCINNDGLNACEIGDDDLVILIYNGFDYGWISDLL